MTLFNFKDLLSVVLLSLTLVPPAAADPLTADDFIAFDPDQAKLGQLLFYDKILSGNRNISCATCHHHDLHSADGLSLGIGEGGNGIGTNRTPGEGLTRISTRIPRNAPALWNLGAKEVSTLFHDGRLERTDLKSAGFRSPAKGDLPHGLNSIIAAQALFPMSSDAEMAGAHGENAVADGFGRSFPDGWAAVTAQVQSVPEYTDLFRAAFPNVRKTQDITVTEIANALGAFIGSEWQSYDSPYDDYVNAGVPLPADAERGRQLFFGKAGCSACHSGPLFTDQDFHAMGLPNFGPGKLFDRNPIRTDLGRMQVTGDDADIYRFRTPSLRNVALTAPYGHNGAYSTLSGMIRHMLDPTTARGDWSPENTTLPRVAWLDKEDFAILANLQESDRQLAYLDSSAVENVSDADVQALEAFLHSLTGKTAASRPLGRPEQVPSGLPVD